MAEAARTREFGEYLASLRKGRKLSQEGLAKAAELSRGYLALIEQGRNTPSRKAVKALAAALEVDLSKMLHLLGYEPDEDDTGRDDRSAVEDESPQATGGEVQATESSDDAGVSPTLQWAYETIKRDPNFDYEQRMGGQDLPPATWVGFIEMYQGLTGRVLLKPDEIQRFRNAPTEQDT